MGISGTIARKRGTILSSQDKDACSSMVRHHWKEAGRQETEGDDHGDEHLKHIEKRE
jgi:hypothetical protein